MTDPQVPSPKEERSEEQADALLDSTTGSSRKPNLLLLCDHVLDPRLNRKVRWLQEITQQQIVVRDTSRLSHCHEHHEDGVTYAGYEQCGPSLLNTLDDSQRWLIYVAGNQVLRDHYSTLRRVSRRHPIIWEIADLPMRHGFPRDQVISTVFRFLLSRINPHFVVTAPGFMRWLPQRRPWLLSENIPEQNLATQLLQLESAQAGCSGRIRVGFPGNIRYYEPLVWLHRFSCEHPDLLEIHIWGGPETAWQKLKADFERESGRLHQVHFHGPFVMDRDGADIYANLDVVWAVYYAHQANVKVALPNRMYEAILAGRWVIAAENTEVSRRIEELRAGFSIPSDTKDYDEFAKKLQLALQEVANRSIPQTARDSVTDIVEQAKQQFQDFVARVTNSQ